MLDRFATWLVSPSPLHKWVAAGGYSPRRMSLFVAVRVAQIGFLIWFLIWLLRSF